MDLRIDPGFNIVNSGLSSVNISNEIRLEFDVGLIDVGLAVGSSIWLTAMAEYRNDTEVLVIGKEFIISFSQDQAEGLEGKDVIDVSP